MPLDGHSYLVAQGWTGSGTGLRQGAISRPLAIPQKKTLAGLGKERDEAFPFWDHLFSAASKSIQIKISKDGEDSDDDSDAEPDANVSLKRTSTGILSNRRPVTGATPAHDSGATTPDIDDISPRLTLLATAKREAAKRNLYSRFFKGPVLGPDSPLPSKPATIVVVKEVAPASLPERRSAPSVEDPVKKKKRKTIDGEEDEKREAKRLRKEQKELKRAEKKSREKREGKKREKGETDTVEAKKERKRKRKEESEAGSREQTEKMKRKEEKRSKKVSAEAAIAPDVEIETGKKRKRPVD
ncbi:hypothetical protein C8F04DRAFT_1046567 [Mycena alexandri]|uniref:Ribosome biogenesis protein n=1 Tax=Mycena alexandri TaxID=1745969 RepID=A0AAD6SD88_9AGAR|nr:hypothetical protein C8F04DRAFT_1046567 [Mycena alexandri]